MTINKSLFAYPACFYKEENGYSVFFPDLDYLATCGETLEDGILILQRLRHRKQRLLRTLNQIDYLTAEGVMLSAALKFIFEIQVKLLLFYFKISPCF